MTFLTLKKQWGKVISSVRSYDGFVMLAGLVGLVAFWLTDSVLARLFCSIVVAISAVLTATSLLRKRRELRGASFHTPVPQRKEGPEVKRLIFDDFQLQASAMHVSGELHDEALPSSPHNLNITPVEKHLGAIVSPPPVSGTEIQISAQPTEFHISDFFDVNSDLFKNSAIESGQPELRNEFDFLLNKVLAVMKEVAFAHTVAFFWANHEKQQMVCEAKITESSNLMTSPRFAMGQDIVSHIARNGNPELISRVNSLAEKDLLRYYESPEDVKSFVGVPVFYTSPKTDQPPSEPIGVIVIDSKAEDAFGPETIVLLGQFTKLISALIKTSSVKYDLMLDAELLNAIRRLQERIRNDFSIPTITQTLAEETGKLLNWNVLSIVLYDEVKRALVIKKVVNRMQESSIALEQRIDFSESIVGNAIKTNAHQLVEDLQRQHLPRYFRGEKSGKGGSFVSVPISSLNKCYGALSIESKDKFNFSRKDIEILYRLAENAASALEILYMNDIIKEYVVTDELTGVYTKRFFMKTFQAELLRADDYDVDLSLLLVTIDHPHKTTDRYGQEGFEHVAREVAKILRSGLRPYDLIGRYDYNRFGVVLVNTPANDAYIWAEKMRKAIASHILTIDRKNLSVTVSIGICGALRGMNKEEILNIATAVLHKGMETGGNTVRIY